MQASGQAGAARWWWRRVAFGALALLAACARGPVPELARQPPAASSGVPVVVVPGVTGTELWDPAGERWVWGGVAPLLRPRDGGYRLALPLVTSSSAPHAQARYRPVGPLLVLRLLGWTKEIYRPLIARLEGEGYRRGSLADPAAGGSLFFFDYDWRRGYLEHVRDLDARLAVLAAARGAADVDLVCQSNAAKICRYLVKYGARAPAEVAGAPPPARAYRVRKVVLAGASGNGALRALRMLDRGRRYLAGGRRLSQETVFTMRPLFEELPAGEDLFFDAAGRTLPVDLHAADAWARLGLSVFDARVAARLARRGRQDLFGTAEDRRRYLADQLAAAARLHALLEADAVGFPRPRYYRLENGSLPTPARGLLAGADGRWRLRFLGDPEVDGDPRLRALATAPGDGHATLASQRHLSPQEDAVVAGVAQVTGGHFEMVVEPAGLAALVGFLAD